MIRRQPPPTSDLAALLLGDRQRRVVHQARIFELLAHCDPTELGDYLERLGVLVFAVEGLSELDRTRVPETLLERSERLSAFILERAELLQEVTAAICTTLEAESIAVLELKGTRLARRLHGSTSGRLSSDIDLLVEAAHLPAAVELARSFGFGPDASEPTPAATPLHIRLNHKTGALPPLELHWRIHWYENQFAAAMLTRSTMVDQVRQPTVHDELAALLIYYARDGFVGLRYPNDIAAWWAQFGSAPADHAMADLSRQHPQLAASWDAAIGMCEFVVGRAPASRSVGTSGRRAALAVRFADWDLVGSTNQASVNVLLVDALCAPVFAWGSWFFRALLPPIPSVSEGDRSRMSTVRRWKLRGLHPFKVILRASYAAAVVACRGRYRPLPNATSGAVKFEH